MTTTLLVKRLRENAKHWALDVDTHLLNEAADYIEMLEAKVDALEDQVDILQTFQKGLL